MERKRTKEDWIICPSKVRKTDGTDKDFIVKKPLFPIDAYTKHKILVNEYILNHRGATNKLIRDTSKDKTDLDILQQNHKFLWDEDEATNTWEKRVAKKYYDKLFKEYCISDLRKYKENKIALRWRTEKEVIEGKGQFSCADVSCNEKDNLKSWEVNFAYIEHGEKKNALVKIRLCPDCSRKLNYHHKRKEAKKPSKKESKSEKELQSEPEHSSTDNLSTSNNQTSNSDFSQVTIKQEKVESEDDDYIWKCNQAKLTEESETIESEMDAYLAELFM